MRVIVDEKKRFVCFDFTELERLRCKAEAKRICKVIHRLNGHGRFAYSICFRLPDELELAYNSLRSLYRHWPKKAVEEEVARLRDRL